MLGPRMLLGNSGAGIKVNEHEAALEAKEISHDVARLQIAMNVPSLMHEPHTVDNFLKHAFDYNRIHDAFVVHNSAQITVGSTHDEEARVIVVNQPPTLFQSSLKYRVCEMVAAHCFNNAVLKLF